MNDDATLHSGNTNPVLDYGTWKLTDDNQLQMLSTKPQPPGYTITFDPQTILELDDSHLKIQTMSNIAIIWTSYKPL